MYLPQMSYHPPVFVWSNYCAIIYNLEYRETIDTLYVWSALFFNVAGTCSCWRFKCIYSCKSLIPSGMCLLPCVHAQGVM